MCDFARVEINWNKENILQHNYTEQLFFLYSDTFQCAAVMHLFIIIMHILISYNE